MLPSRGQKKNGHRNVRFFGMPNLQPANLQGQDWGSVQMSVLRLGKSFISGLSLILFNLETTHFKGISAGYPTNSTLIS